MSTTFQDIPGRDMETLGKDLIICEVALNYSAGGLVYTDFVNVF